MIRTLLPLPALALLLPASALAQTVVYVDDDAPTGGDGASWATAHRFLQEALAHRGDLDIRVGAGTYRPDRSEAAPAGTGDRFATFTLRSGVSVTGGYAGFGATNPDERDPETHQTTLSGDLAGDDGPNFAGNAENAFHVLEAWNTDNTTLLDGLTITAGHANRPDPNQWYQTDRDDSGAGMLLVESDAIVRDCRFVANDAAANGHIFVALSGIFAYVEAGGGGALTVAGSPTFDRCVFDANRTGRLGGALGMWNGTVVVKDCLFTNNSAHGPDRQLGLGGAIADSTNINITPRARVVNSAFIGNSTEGGGGALHIIFSNTSYSNCLFLANESDFDGGAILVDNGVNTEFVNCSIVGNRAVARAGGLQEVSEIPDITFVDNCLFWGNESGSQVGSAAQINSLVGGHILMNNSCVQDFDSFASQVIATNTITADPLFVDPVGPDLVPWSGDEDLHLQPGSPCHDAGDTTLVRTDFADIDNDGDTAEPTPLDLDRNPRFTNDPAAPDTGIGPAPIVDIGAYELVPSAPTCPCEYDGVAGVDVFDLLAYLDLWFALDPGAELTGDDPALIDVFDLLAFLDCWFPASAGDPCP